MQVPALAPRLGCCGAPLPWDCASRLKSFPPLSPLQNSYKPDSLGRLSVLNRLLQFPTILPDGTRCDVNQVLKRLSWFQDLLRGTPTEEETFLKHPSSGSLRSKRQRGGRVQVFRTPSRCGAILYVQTQLKRCASTCMGVLPPLR